MDELLKTWREVWFEMANGVQSDYEKIKAMDVFEYFAVFDLWKIRMRRDGELLKAKAKNRLL